MNDNFKNLLLNLSASIDKPVLDDPRLDFLPSPRCFPVLGRQSHFNEVSRWAWQGRTLSNLPAKIPLNIRHFPIQVAFGFIQWVDFLSHTATRGSGPILRRSPLFLADAKIEEVDSQQIIKITSEPSLNSFLISWFKKHDIHAIIDQNAMLCDAFKTDNTKIEHKSFNDVHFGVFLSPLAQLARTLNPDQNPEIMNSYGAAILAGEDIEPLPKRYGNVTLDKMIKLDTEQKLAVIAALRGDNFILIGPPGCGKTQTIAAIIRNISAIFPHLVIGVASPVTAALDALIRLIDDDSVNYKQYNVDKYNSPENIDILIVDESSRTTTAEIFPLAINTKQIIIVGDPAQSLPTPAKPRLDAQDISLIHRALDNPHFKRYELRNHYRSYQPDLLAFANGFVYDGRLNVVPAQNRSPKDGFCMHYVSGAGAQSTHHATINIKEAHVVASALVSEAIIAATLGISRSRMAVAWTPSHALRLEKAIEIELKNRNIDKKILSPVPGEPFIVYSAGEIQGQERDETWISFGHGIDTHGKLACARQPSSNMSVGSIQKMNILTTRSRLATHLYHSVTPLELFTAKPTNEILTLFALMIIEMVDAHSRYQIDPNGEANAVAERLLRDNATCPHPEAINLACVFGVKDRSDPPSTWRFGLFRRRPEWSHEEYNTIQAMLIAKKWKLINF